MPTKNKPPFFLPYQMRWLNDNSKVKIWEKSRRIGATYVQSYEDVRDCVKKTVPAVWFSSADESAAREYIDYCKIWANLFNVAAKDLGEQVLDKEKDVKAYVIAFSNGTKIHALSSNPKGFRSKGGKVVLDEFAFHNNPAELWKAARPCITWGYPLRILSTHNGQSCLYYRFLDQVEKGNNIVVITPATPGASGLTPAIREKLGKHYVDVGIAEQQAVAFASGIAKNGAKPVLEVLSSFIQRAYDQLSQDLALNNTPATILIYWGTISCNDATHLGIFDIPLISNIPNIVYLAPTNKEEYLAMLDWSVNKNKDYSVAIRVPYVELKSVGIKDNTDYSKLNKFKIIDEGKDVAIIAVGNFFELGENVKKELKKHDINATLINPKFISGLDKKMLEDLKKNHKIVITLEDGIIEGGFGQKIASYYGNSNIKVLNYGAEKEFADRINLDELYNKYHLTKELITKDILDTLK